MKPNKQNVKKNYLSSDFSPNFLSNLFIKKNSKKIYKLMEEYELNTIKDEHNTTLLHFACQYNKIDIVESMIKLGADINAINNFSLTPISMATSRNYYDLVKLLLTHGAEVFLPDHNGNTPLHYAGSNVEIINLLIDNGADPFVKNNQGEIPYHKSYFAVESLQKYLDYGISINAQTNDGNTVLHSACRNRYLDVVQFLISKNVDIHIQNKEGKTPLDFAVRYNFIDIVNAIESCQIVQQYKEINESIEQSNYSIKIKKVKL